MKTRIIIALSLVAFSAWAGNTCFTTTTQEDSLIVAACGRANNLGRDCTGAEVKAWVISWVKGQVMDDQRKQDIITFSPTPINPQ